MVSSILSHCSAPVNSIKKIWDSLSSFQKMITTLALAIFAIGGTILTYSRLQNKGLMPILGDPKTKKIAEEKLKEAADTIRKKDPKIFADIIDCFAGKNSHYPIQNFLGPIKLIRVKSQAGLTINFFGIEKDQQAKVPFAQFKAKLAKVMGIPTQNALEIIGDSSQFSETGSNYVRSFLRPHFAQNRMIEYGFTGYVKGKELDINSFLNEYVEDDPSQAHKVLANIVGHTHTALTQWGTAGSFHVRNFVVVYSADGMSKEPMYNHEGKKVRGYTTFGDDIIISDHLLQAADGDRVICMEGGVQSFRQIMNALSLNIPVDLVYNLRKPDREGFFSAARFLKAIKTAFKNDYTPSPDEVRKIYIEYETSLKSIWDPSKADYLTKKELFDTAINDFINKGIYKNIATHCTFYDANE